MFCLAATVFYLPTTAYCLAAIAYCLAAIAYCLPTIAFYLLRQQFLDTAINKLCINRINAPARKMPPN